MPGGSPVTANDILSYQGDSALAGGMGAAGNASVINGVWKLADSIGEINKMLNYKHIAKQKQEYDRKIADRNEFATLLDNGQLTTNEMDDDDRLQKGAEIKTYKDELVNEFKKGNLSDETYLNLHKKYSDIRDSVIRSKANYAAMKADMDAMGDPYDKSAGYVKSTSKSTVNENGVQETTTEQEKTPNIRANEENKSGLQKHIDAFKEEKKKNPNAMYKPYVPLLDIKDSDVFLPVGVDEKKTPSKDGLKVSVEIKPNLQKTIDTYLKAATDPDTNAKLKRKYNQILGDISSGGVYGKALINSTNDKLKEIQANEGIEVPLEITPATNYLQAMALINYAKGYEQSFKTQTRYVDANAEKKDLRQFDFEKDQQLENTRSANTRKEISARESSTIRTQNNEASNQQALEKLKQKGKKGTSSVDEDGNPIEPSDVYYQDGLGKVKRLDEKAKAITGDDLDEKFGKKKGMGKSGIKQEDVKELKEVSASSLSKELKSYFQKSETVYRVEKKTGEIVYVDTQGNTFSTDDLVEIAAGSSKAARQEMLDRKRSNPSQGATSTNDAPKKRKVIINADGTTTFK